MTEFYYCPECGRRYDAFTWPRKCTDCYAMVYQNPKPVAVMLVPVGNGLLAIRRGVKADPGYGKIALPGGFINMGETWQAAGIREVLEETGYIISQILHHATLSAPDGTLLIFGIANQVKPPTPSTQPNTEVLAIEVIEEREWLRVRDRIAFPLHTEAISRYWQVLDEDG